MQCGEKNRFSLVCQEFFLTDLEVFIAVSSENCNASKGCPYFIDENMDIFREPTIFNIISGNTVCSSLCIQILMLLCMWAIYPSIVISHLMGESFRRVSYSKWKSSCSFSTSKNLNWQKKKTKIGLWLKYIYTERSCIRLFKN